MTAVPPPSGEYQPFVAPVPGPQAPQAVAPVSPSFPTGGYGSAHRPNELLKAGTRNSWILAVVLFVLGPIIVIGGVLGFLILGLASL